MLARRAALRSFVMGCVLAAGSELAAQGSTVNIRPAPVAGGAIAGVVRDQSGEVLADVRILIEGLARQTRTAANGAFVLEGLPAGTHLLRFRKLGFAEAQAELRVIADSAITVGVTLAPVAERLDPVLIESTILNQVSLLVTNQNGTPLEGVVVEVLGMNTRFETNADGRHVLLDLKPGNYLLQFRAPGYRVSQYGLRMVAQIERDISIKLQPARVGDRLTAAMAAMVALEANRRQSLRGGRSILMGRDELERFDTAPLSVALAGSRASLILAEVNSSCILINGFEPLTTESALERASAQTTRSNPNGFFGNAPSTAPATASNGNAFVKGGWLAFFRANEVEMLEIYAEGSENSRTVCGRFPVSSGCSCPPEPSAIVIWLRR